LHFKKAKRMEVIAVKKIQTHFSEILEEVRNV